MSQWKYKLYDNIHNSVCETSMPWPENGHRCRSCKSFKIFDIENKHKLTSYKQYKDWFRECIYWVNQILYFSLNNYKWQEKCWCIDFDVTNKSHKVSIFTTTSLWVMWINYIKCQKSWKIYSSYSVSHNFHRKHLLANDLCYSLWKL